MPRQDRDYYAGQQQQQAQPQQHPYYAEGHSSIAAQRGPATQAQDPYDVAFPERYADSEGLISPTAPGPNGASDGFSVVSPFDVAPFLGDEFFALPTSPPNGSASAGATSPPSGASGPSVTSAIAGSSAAGGAIGEELLTGAVEEDKRRRNTAASARFRMKKKEREAELERRTRDMNDRCGELEKRINILETENRWLRELITERSRNRGTRRPVEEPAEKEEKDKGKGRRRSGS
jgi:hypothetical protein